MNIPAATLFVVLAGAFGAFLMFSRPENIERPTMVGTLTLLAALAGGGLIFLESRQGELNGHRIAWLYAALPVVVFGIGRAIDRTMGPRRMSADERQATLGAELAD